MAGAAAAAATLQVATYKLNFHTTENNWAAVAQRIATDERTDVWCLQGGTVRSLKALPDAFSRTASRGLMFVSRDATVRLTEVAYVNLAPLLLEAALQCTAVADALPISAFHLRKLPLVVAFAACEVLRPQAGDRPAEPPAPCRTLIVNVDFERVRDWGTPFHCSVVHVLSSLIWGEKRGYTRQWRCRHVCLAGSFFFPPDSAPYAILTTRSAGVPETVPALFVVPPYICSNADNDEGAAASAVPQTCSAVVSASAQRACAVQEVLGVHIERAAHEAPLQHVRAFLDCSGAAAGQELELSPEGSDGWWLLREPLDTFATQAVVVRLQWPASSGDAQKRRRVHFLVRADGVLPPQWQAAERVVRGGAPALRSIMAGSCAAEGVATAAAELAALQAMRGQAASPPAGLGTACGEPLITALYQTSGPIASGCHDYIFVSTFAGVTTVSRPPHSIATFAQELVTPHLPLCTRITIPLP